MTKKINSIIWTITSNPNMSGKGYTLEITDTDNNKFGIYPGIVAYQCKIINGSLDKYVRQSIVFFNKCGFKNVSYNTLLNAL